MNENRNNFYKTKIWEKSTVNSELIVLISENLMTQTICTGDGPFLHRAQTPTSLIM